MFPFVNVMTATHEYQPTHVVPQHKLGRGHGSSSEDEVYGSIQLAVRPQIHHVLKHKVNGRWWFLK